MKVEQKRFIEDLELLLEAEHGSISMGDQLEGMSGWDSMAVMGFIAMVDGKYGKAVSPQVLLECVTVSDLYGMVAE